MMARTGVVDTISTTPDSAMAPSKAMATPMSAVTMGRPAPTSVPSMTNRTIAATTRPTASPGPTTSGIPVAMDVEKSTPTPSTGVAVKAAMRPSLVSAGTAVWAASNITAATAALPSSDTRRTPDERSSSVAPASSLWVWVAICAGAASISACFSLMVAQPASMAAWPSASFCRPASISACLSAMVAEPASSAFWPAASLALPASSLC